MNERWVHPEQFEVSPASEHDHEHLEVFINEPLATYVFDRGYLDFAQFDQMHWDGYFFVSRIKKNTKVHVQGHLDVLKRTGIISEVGSIGPSSLLDESLSTCDDRKKAASQFKNYHQPHGCIS